MRRPQAREALDRPRAAIERSRRARARVQLVQEPQSASAADGSVTSKQVADVTLPRSELERIWNPEYLERLARTYWLFLRKVSFGLLRVVYSPFSREVVLLRRPFRLLTFRGPRYRAEATRGTVTWPIDRGILVAPNGRGKGYLRITVERPDDQPTGDEITVRVSSEVANFYPAIAAGWLPRWVARIGSFLYRVTQLRIHVIVTNAFLRSLARLDLAPSVVGALRAQAREAAAEGDLETMAEASAAAADEERRQASAADG
ncbi:MAG: hypothetical protein QOG86_1812 [Thermoleophilaceae bacterium]|nr:hypothetical protein [Thermoleophilaceae bacterium]MEA2350871.1 hypothetical protein [Thermoleophilaceae bacterium]